MEKELILGLSQAATDCLLPEILVRKSLWSFLSRDFDALYPPLSAYCIIAHPPETNGNLIASGQGDSSIFSELDALQAQQEGSSRSGAGRVVVAVGPEGGWETEEVSLFEGKGFRRVQLGKRILRTDIAVRSSQVIFNILSPIDFCPLLR